MEDKLNQEEIKDVQDVVEGNKSIETDKASVNADEVKDVQETNASDDKSEEKIYTQADIDALQAQIDELLKYKPKELSEEEIKLQQKAEQLWQKQIELELKSHGLEMFKDFIRVDVGNEEGLKEQILKLKEIVGKLELSSGYQPTNHKPVDAYALAKKSKDVKRMISAKLNLFQ